MISQLEDYPNRKDQKDSKCIEKEEPSASDRSEELYSITEEDIIDDNQQERNQRRIKQDGRFSANSLDDQTGSEISEQATESMEQQSHLIFVEII